MKTRVLLIIAIAFLIASCGTKEQAVKNETAEKVVVPPPVGVEVVDVETKVFSSLNLPKGEYWVEKNEEATFRHDEYILNKMSPSDGKVGVIRTMSYGGFSKDLNDVSAVVKSIDNYAAGSIIRYNDFHFKYDSLGNKLGHEEFPHHTSILDTLENGYVVIFVEAEVQNKNKENRFFGTSYYARNYFFLAEKDDKNKIPIISSSIVLKPDNYKTEKAKFIELVDYVVNTAVVNPEFKFKK